MNKKIYSYTFYKQILVIIAIFSALGVVNGQNSSVNSKNAPATKNVSQNASFKSTDSVSVEVSKSNISAPKTILNKRIRINAGETIEMPFNLGKDLQTGITFFSSPGITVSLVDSEGNVQQSIKAGTAEAAEMVKTFHLSGSVAGSWKLRFENQSSEYHTAVVSIWAEKASSTLSNLEFINY